MAGKEPAIMTIWRTNMDFIKGKNICAVKNRC